MRIHSVVHLVAYYSFSGERSPKYNEITVRGTEFLLNNLNLFLEWNNSFFQALCLFMLRLNLEIKSPKNPALIHVGAYCQI